MSLPHHEEADGEILAKRLNIIHPYPEELVTTFCVGTISCFAFE